VACSTFKVSWLVLFLFLALYHSFVWQVGASGAIGQITCQQLLDDGFKVKGLTREPEKIKQFASKAEWISKVDWVEGDLKKTETLKPAFKGVDKVIFAAGAHAYEEGLANNKR
jgi:uncharacterized protein YbjT (DUF2867 family)